MHDIDDTPEDFKLLKREILTVTEEQFVQLLVILDEAGDPSVPSPWREVLADKLNTSEHSAEEVPST